MITRYPRRFTGRTVPISFWCSVKLLLTTGKWMREKFIFEEVKPGTPGYDEAPYEEDFIWN